MSVNLNTPFCYCKTKSPSQAPLAEIKLKKRTSNSASQAYTQHLPHQPHQAFPSQVLTIHSAWRNSHTRPPTTNRQAIYLRDGSCLIRLPDRSRNQRGLRRRGGRAGGALSVRICGSRAIISLEFRMNGRMVRVVGVVWDRYLLQRIIERDRDIPCRHLGVMSVD